MYIGQPVSPRAKQRYQRGRARRKNPRPGSGPRWFIPPPAPQQGGGGGGYGGLDDIIARLSQGNITQQQIDRMSQGRTGGAGWGAIGGMNGRMAGLSPYAAHWLATSGVMKKNEYTPEHALTRDVTGADGTVTQQALEGPELFRAQLMNSLGQQNFNAQGPTYDLAEGIDQDFLAQVFGMGFGGKSAYEKGFGAEGRLPGQPPRMGRPWRPGPRPGRRFGRGGRLIRHGPVADRQLYQ